MKNKIIYLLLMLIMLSCKKSTIGLRSEDQTFFAHTTKNDLVNWAIENLGEQNYKLNFASKIKMQYGQPEWDYSDAFYAYEGMPTIVVPFIGKNANKVNAIWIIVYDQGQIKSQIVSEENLAATRAANSSNKMSGDFAQMFMYLNGKIFDSGSKLSYRVDKLSSKGPVIQDRTSYYAYVETCVDWWQYASVGGQIIPGSFQYTNTTCKTEMVWIPEIMTNSTTPPNTSSSPPAGYGNLTPTSFAKIKMDAGNRECLGKIAADITKFATVSHHLQRVFAGVTGFSNVNSMIDRLATSTSCNVEIKEGNILPEIDDDGNTEQPNAITKATGGKVTITVNKGYLNVATDLAVARTVIHELLHTYFEYGKSLASDPDYSTFMAVNDLLYNRSGGLLNDQNLAQHNLIASCYVDQISFLLYAYADSKGITSPDPNLTLMDYCRDLAWGGLKGSKGYRFLKNKTRVESNIMKEQNNTSTSTKVKSCS